MKTGTMRRNWILATLVIIFSSESNGSIHRRAIPTECPKQDSIHGSVMLPHESDCTKFYTCANGKPILSQCPVMDENGNRLHFNPVLQVCDWPAHAGCVRGTKPTTAGTGTWPTWTNLVTGTSKGNSESSAHAETRTSPTPSVPNIKVPHEYNCSLYYEYVHGERVLKQCPNNLHFSPTQLVCRKPAFAGCESDLPTNPECGLACGDTPDGWLIPHECLCNLYYRCRSGNLVRQQCSNGLHFNAERFSCDYPESAGCEKTTTESTTTKPTTSGIPSQCPPDNSGGTIQFPHPTNCSLFYTCDNGEKQLLQCPNGLHFNPVIQMCDWPDSAGCTATSETPATSETDTETSQPTVEPTTEIRTTESTVVVPTSQQPNDCPTDDTVKLPHPHNCSLYYECEDGKMVLRVCPEGLEFSPDLNVCDWPEVSGCLASTTIGTPTTTTEGTPQLTTGKPTETTPQPTTGRETEPTTEPTTGRETEPPPEPTPAVTPKPTTGSETEPPPEPTPVATPKPTTGSETEPPPEPTPVATPKPTTGSETEPPPEPTPVATPKPTTGSETEPPPESTPAVTPKPTTGSETEPPPEPTPVATPKPTTGSETEPPPEPTPVATSKPTTGSETEPPPEPTPEATQKPTTGSETEAPPEPTPEATPKPTTGSETEPPPEPTPEVTQKPTTGSETEAPPEPTPEATPKPTTGSETEPPPEPTPEATPKPTTGSETEAPPEPTPEATPKPTTGSETEAPPEPTPEATPKPTTGSETEAPPAPTPEATPKPTTGSETEAPPEPTPEATPKPTTGSVTEAPPEPTPEATPKPTTGSVTEAPPKPTTEDTVDNGNEECPSDNSGQAIHIPHPYNCSLYYECDNGRKVLKSCPEGLEFNPRKQVCDWPSDAGCVILTPEVTTTEATVVPSAAPETTVRPSEPSEPEKTTDATECTAEDQGRLTPHETDCTLYYECIDGRKILEECTPGLHFSPALEICVWPENAGCESTTTPSDASSIVSDSTTQAATLPDENEQPGGAGCIGTCPPKDPENYTVLLRHEDCTKFCKCSNSIPYVYECPSGLHFSPTSLVCDYPQNAQCQGINGVPPAEEQTVREY